MAQGQSPEQEVKAKYAGWDAAFAKGDAKAISELYTDGATFLPANHEVYKGPAGVEKFFTALFAGGARAHKLDLIEASGSENLVYGAARWSAMGKDAAGKDQPWAGIATHVFERQADGNLKIKLHTFN